jgi:hypothetical protein
MSERRARLLGIVGVVLSLLSLTYTALWFAGLI